MTKQILLSLVVLFGLLAGADETFGRGFGGGFHAGGFGGGGFGGYRGGGFDAGGFRSGGFNSGGFGGDRFGGEFGGDRAGGFDLGGLRPGDFDAGGSRGSELGGDRFNSVPSRGQLNDFLGLPTDAGLHAAGGDFAGRGFTSGQDGAATGRFGASGHIYQGPRGTTIARGAIAGEGIADGPRGAAGGRGVAGGTVVKGPDGNVYARGAVTGRGFAGADGTHAFSTTYYHARGVATRGWYAGRGWFTPGWINGHPWAWYPGRYSPAGWAAAAWAATSWATVGPWLSWDEAPVYYDYGSNVTYEDGGVYYGDQFEATTDDYYKQAQSLAASNANAAGEDADWLPLGIFSIVEGEQTKPSMTVELAVSKQGVVSGNAMSEVSKAMSTVHGGVDKRTQRIAWTVGDAKDTVYETGLYNLTKQEAPGLIHFGTDRTEQVVLVRLKQDERAKNIPSKG